MTGINQLIIKSGLKKKHVAKKLGLSDVELSHIIHRRRKPNAQLKKKIVQLLNEIKN